MSSVVNIPTHATTSNILHSIGFKDNERVYELYLGDDCTLLLEVKCGFFISLQEDFCFWVEVMIMNSQLLPESLKPIKCGRGYEYILTAKNEKELETEIQSYIATALEVVKTIIWPYREELIEFIKGHARH